MLGQDNYGLSALHNECSAIAATPNGERNNRLNEAAFKLGQLVAGGELERSQAYEGLIEAAKAIRLPLVEATATIKSGLKAGAKEPRQRPNGHARHPFFTEEQLQASEAKAANRDDLTLSAWLERGIPARDYLLGGVLCTTSRWFVYGETGVGKTLFGIDMAAAIAAFADFLRWTGQRQARVLYLDGELPRETFKERMELIAKRYGPNIPFYGYNREDLGDDGLPALNTPQGQEWLRREIDAIKPDIIFFDSIFCLLQGSAKDEETWAPMKHFVRELTCKRIAQVWFNQANEIGKSFGDKTREWEMDTVIKLSHPPADDDQPDTAIIRMEFQKARLRTPANFKQFDPLIIRLGVDDWMIEDAPMDAKRGKGLTDFIRTEYLHAYDRLADGVKKEPGFDGQPVIKVSVKAIRNEMKNRGFLPTNEEDCITRSGTTMLWQAKSELMKSKKLTEGGGMVWRI